MEIGERLLSGASMHDLAHGSLLAIGLGVQLAVATVGAYILRLTERVAELAEERLRSSLRSVPALRAGVSVSSVTPRRPAMRAAASRAPPSLL